MGCHGRTDGNCCLPDTTAHPHAEPVWRTATASGAHSCVEVAVRADGDIAVRHSRMPYAPRLRFTPAEWAAFVQGCKAGEFDLPEVSR